MIWSKVTWHCILCSILTPVLTIGCSRLDPASSAPIAKWLAKLRSDPIVASVGGFPITQSQIVSHFNKVVNSGYDPRVRSVEGRKEWLNGYIYQCAPPLIAIQKGVLESDEYKA